MRFLRFLLYNLARLISAIGVGGLAFLGVMGLNDPKQFFSSNLGHLSFAFLAIFLAGQVVDWIQAYLVQRRLDEDVALRARITSLETLAASRESAMAELIGGNLRLIAQLLDCDAGDRISLYKHRNDGAFRLVGRYSQHQEYNDVRRATIPRHEGLVSEVWAVQEERYIDISVDPSIDVSGYAEEQHDSCKVPVATARSFLMKSRNYRAFPVSDGDRSQGVIVLESIVPGRFSGNVTVRGKVRRVIEGASTHLTLSIIAADETWPVNAQA